MDCFAYARNDSTSVIARSASDATIQIHKLQIRERQNHQTKMENLNDYSQFVLAAYSLAGFTLAALMILVIFKYFAAKNAK